MTNDLTITSNSLDAGGFRKAVFELQEDLLKLPQVEVPLTHRFVSGVYTREATIPAGVVAIGKIHKFDHIIFLMKGEITVVTEEGAKRLVAPCSFVSPANTKRAAYTHTEVVWVNVHAPQSTSIEDVENELVHDEYNDDGFLDYVHQTLRIGE